MKTYIATLNPVSIDNDEFTSDHFENRINSMKRIETMLEGKVTSETFSRFKKHLNLLTSLPQTMQKNIFTHTTFYYWCYHLFELYRQNDPKSLEAWMMQLHRFGIVEALKEGLLTESITVPVQNRRIIFPNVPFDIELNEDIKNNKFAVLTVENSSLSIRVGDLTSKVPITALIGGSVAHEMIKSHVVLQRTNIQVYGGEPFLDEYLNKWNRNFSQDSELVQIETISEAKKTHIENCLGLLERTWPEFVTEFRGNVQMIVPFVGGERHAFTTTVWPGAIFISDTFGKPIFTVERLVHEASHLRLNAIMSKDPLHLHGPDFTVPSPFRAGPRPVIGLYHGIFVFTRVAQAMIRIYEETGEELYAQRIPFLVNQVNEAVTTIETHNLKLTTLGRDLLEKIIIENKKIENICNKWNVNPLSKDELVKLGFDNND